MTIWTPKLPKDKQSKYEAIAASIEAAIAKGSLKPGQKLPTQRDLAKRLSVTIGTVGRAYALAEKRGFVSLEIGRGSFVRSLGTSVSEIQRGQSRIDFGLNLPPRTRQSHLFARTLARISRLHDVAVLFGDAPVEAFAQHRIAAAKWLTNRVDCTADDVLICNGTQNGLVAILSTVAKPGDSILVEELTFPGMIAVARLLHLKLIPIRMDSDGILPTDLERASRDSNVLYCIPTNQNPTTATMSLNRRQEISEIAKKRNLTIIEDDVYGMLPAKSLPPIASLLPEQTFMISSLAKTVSIGLRLAFVRVPSPFRETMIRNLRASNFFPSPLLCEIASLWIDDGTAMILLQELRETGADRRRIAVEILTDKFATDQFFGNHLWLPLPDEWPAETLVRAAKENGVHLYAASTFAAPELRAPNAIRIALGGAKNESELRDGLGIIARLLNETNEPSTTRY